MASLEHRNRQFRVVFRLAGRKYGRTLKTKSEKAARAILARLDDNLQRVELGTLDVPEDADLVSFLLSDGKVSAKPRPSAPTRLDRLVEDYFAALPSGSIEDSTLKCLRIHTRHLLRVLGNAFNIITLRIEDLEAYAATRAKEQGLRGQTVSRITVKKEIATFSAIWSWAERRGFVSRSFPKRGLRYPKTTEKPPFRTWVEVEQRIARGGLTPAQLAEIWDCLFLTVNEITELLAHVKQQTTAPFVYPMFVFAAHTGARRSEMIRSTLDDIDFATGMITIHEKKRVRGRCTTRSVPMSANLTQTMRSWFAVHPGGNDTFCDYLHAVGETPRRFEVRGLTANEAHDSFKLALHGSKWSRLRGWHIFRHSFCSNAAAAGVDQRMINGWVGHQTEEMVKRYRHLIPHRQQEAIRLVFS